MKGNADPDSHGQRRPDRRKTVGTEGELLARRHLEANGYKIVAGNWRCRSGEIDIIAEQADVLVFVEVRTRSGSRFGLPQESVDRRKQEKLIRLAQLFIQSHRLHDKQVRFDVIAVEMSAATNEHKVRHIENAF